MRNPHGDAKLKSWERLNKAAPNKPIERGLPPDQEAQVISLKERSFQMLKNDLILRNPIRLLAPDGTNMLSDGGFGAITARAGVGKTAFLVQIVLNSQLEGKNVLHISLNDPVKKVDLWYKEVFRLLAEQYHVQQINQLWEAILPHRFIMTFRAESFTVPVFDERLSDLIDQGIFYPQIVIIDGLSFEPPDRDLLTGLKLSAKEHKFTSWFAVRSHRHETPDDDGIPAPLSPVIDLFEAAIQLQPTGKEINVLSLKGGKEEGAQPELFLDPSTMLIKDK